MLSTSQLKECARALDFEARAGVGTRLRDRMAAGQQRRRV
jgi:hypothetical protein